jgi:hypothetical protein
MKMELVATMNEADYLKLIDGAHVFTDSIPDCGIVTRLTHDDGYGTNCVAFFVKANPDSTYNIYKIYSFIHELDYIKEQELDADELIDLSVEILEDI